MNRREASALLATAVPRQAGTWAEFGAGEGTFTRALADLLPPPSRIYAVDRDARALRALGRQTGVRGVAIVTVPADFTEPFALSGSEPGGLDGILLANALHFVQDPGAVLRRLVEWLSLGGRVVLVEYDGRPASRWVPHPVTVSRLPDLADAAGVSPFTVTATRPSAYGGALYVAAATRL